MEFAVHTVLLLTLLYTNLTRAQNLEPNQIAPNIPSSSENEVISQPPTGLDLENPHDGLMCTNVSMWSPVYWTTENVTECLCEIETKEEVEMKEVCMNVTSMNCTLELSLNCSKTMKNESNMESIWQYDSMAPWRCIEGRETVFHNKTAVECKKIPTYYCDSIWEILENGTKVWVGNDQCDYYEWEDCQLVTREAKFEEPIVSCTQEGEIPFRRINNDTKMTTLQNETCEMVPCVQCLPVTENICKEIEVVNTYQEIIEKCTNVSNLVPTQDFEHIEKCFFNQNPVCDPATTCSGNGICKTDGSCDCNEGFTGIDCAIPVITTVCVDAMTSCSGKGTCNTDGSCDCDDGFTGIDCNTTVCTDAGTCNGYGRCKPDGSCICNPGFNGTDCGTFKCTSDEWGCNNHGTCNNDVCACNAFFTGIDCSIFTCVDDNTDIEVNDGMDNSCNNKGTCTDGKCTCEWGTEPNCV